MTFARSTGAMAGLAEAGSPATALKASASLDTRLLVGSEDRPSGLARPIVWLGLAGWVVCCAMLFVSLVQREPMGGPEAVADAASSLPAIVSAALATARNTFGDTEETDGAVRRSTHPTAERDPGQRN